MPEHCRLLATALLTAMLAAPVFAQQIDKVESDLASTIQALESAAKQQEKLEARNTKLRKELTTLQNDLVSITSKIQRQEKLLSELETNLQNLQNEERDKADKLLLRRREQAHLIQTILKLSTVPPEMVVAMPGNFENTLRTAKVLGLTTKTLTQEAEQISRELGEIHALQDQIKQNHYRISSQKTTLEKNESVMAAKLDARETIQNTLLSRYAQQEQQVQKLSKASETLKELMSQLEDRHLQAQQKAAKLAMVPSNKPSLAVNEFPPKQDNAETAQKFTQAKGRISLPAEGKIFTSYGDATKDGDASRGISLRTREGAKVTAPYAGEIVYTGTFLDYGNMVIIRHEGGYHSLLAGMDVVRAKFGQQVIKNEPIGEMGRNNEKTALYMEIRKDNRPIDPMPWLEAQQYATN
ncbi:MAG: peptidoglycan DD-metalloendopeptidase family protein [Alphaproteobacteria bacterium]|nr:peptidoglycan DD-metalloendopeptidase family protein [Alphaproteobacteria bacterium]